MTSTESVCLTTLQSTLTYYESLAQLAAARTTIALEDRSAWTTESMLKGVLAELQLAHVFDLEIEMLQRVQAELAQDWRLAEVFDIPHDSDESCSAHLLLSDGKPVLAYFAMGDRSDYSDGVRVLDVAWTRNVARQLLTLMLEQQLERLQGESPLAKPAQEQVNAFWSEVRYICPVTPQVFHVESPKWACGFSHLFSSHDAMLYLDGGLHALAALHGFEGFVNKKPSWSSDDDSQDALFRLADGRTVTADASQVLFHLGQNQPMAQADFQLAMQCILAPSAWRCVQTQLSRGHEQALTFSQHVQGELQSRFVLLAFQDVAAAKAAHLALAQGQGLLNQDHPQVSAVAHTLNLAQCRFA